MRKIFVCFSLTLFCLVGLAQSSTPVPPSAGPQGATTAPKAGSTVTAVRAHLALRTGLSSNGSTAGKAVKAALMEPVMLPNGEMLPKGTLVLGSVAAASKHSKDKPNGALVLEFNRAVVKGHDSVPLLVRIEQLAPSLETENAKIALPNSNGNMIATAANSGGQLALAASLNDHTSGIGKFAVPSSVKDVYISPSSQGSGAVFSLGEDVYLEPDTVVTVLMAPAPESSVSK